MFKYLISGAWVIKCNESQNTQTINSLISVFISIVALLNYVPITIKSVNIFRNYKLDITRYTKEHDIINMQLFM